MRLLRSDPDQRVDAKSLQVVWADFPSAIHNLSEAEMLRLQPRSTEAYGPL